MARKAYRGEKIEVSFDGVLCLHAAECVRGLPDVFDRDRRPWILPDNALPPELLSVIKRGPTGALQYRLDGAADEQPAPSTTVTPIENGPLLLRGQHIGRHEDGTSGAVPRAALCRCGQSKNKPFCDNSHLDAGFQAPGIPLADALADRESTATSA